MKYILPQAKPEWKIKPQTIRELEDAFAQMERCAERRPEIDMNDIRQVERYQFESQSALDKAQNARGAIMLVNYSRPVQEQIDRFKAEDYMPLDALMALSGETREISRLKDFFSSVNTHIKPKDVEERERRQGDFRIVYQRCLDYAKGADELPVQCRNMIYMMLAQICCNMHAMSTQIDSGYAPGDLFDPIQGYEYASKVERADGAKAFICTRIERQMGQGATGGLSMTNEQFKQKKKQKHYIIIAIMVVLGIGVIIAASALLWIAFVVFCFYMVFKMMISDATGGHSGVSTPKFGPNSNYGGAQCGKCMHYDKATCPRYPTCHPNDAACGLLNKPTW